ncbi:MAG: transcription termination/antitermination protein NusG [Anaerolineae bacterium]
MSIAASWYAIHTKPRKEHSVRQSLEDRGIETYLPTCRVCGSARGGAPREEPFFARYLFARLDLSLIPISSIHWSPGVSEVVSLGGRPTAVDDRVIAMLRRRLAAEDANGYYKGLPLKPDDRLQVTEGPLKGLEAVFDRRLSADDRVQVLVWLLGQLAPCEVPLGWLARV